MKYLDFYNTISKKLSEKQNIPSQTKILVKAVLLETICDILESQQKENDQTKQQLEQLLSTTAASLGLANKKPDEN